MEELDLINNYMGVIKQSDPLLKHLSNIDYKQWKNLMPVVEKILSETYEDTGENIFFRTFGMIGEDGNYMVRFNREYLHEDKFLLTATYNAVISHIRISLTPNAS